MTLQPVEVIEPPSTSVFWVYLSSFTFLLAGAIFYLYLARALPESDLGAVVILSAIAALMPVAFSLGIGPGFQHFLSFYLGRSDLSVLKRLVQSAFFFALVLSLASAVTTLALSTGLSDLFFHTRAYSGAIAILAVFAGLQTANSTLQSVLLGLQRFATYSVVFIAGSVATYGLALGFLWVRPGVDSIVLGWTVGATFACALYVAAILRASGSWSVPAGTLPGAERGPSLPRSVLAYSLPLFVWSILATGALYVDRLVLASVADLASVGVYNYALLIASGSAVIVGPFTTILIPKASRFFGQRNDAEIRSLTRSAITLITLIYAPIGLGVAALGPFLLEYLAGPGFVVASGPMAVLLVLAAIFIPYTILSSIAAGTRRTLAFAKAAGLALITNVVLSVFLVPRFGMLGAAVGNSSMSWVPFAVFYAELRPTGLVRFDLHSLGRIWFATGAMAVVVGVPLWFLGYSLVFVPVFVLAGIACLAVLVRLLGAISPETATTLLQLMPKWLRGMRFAIYWLAPEYRRDGVPAVSGVGLSYSR